MIKKGIYAYSYHKKIYWEFYQISLKYIMMRMMVSAACLHIIIVVVGIIRVSHNVFFI